MRGTERRKSVGGRRSTDMDASARAGVAIPAWVRIGILILALALSAYSLLHARQINSKPRGAAIAHQAIDDNASLMAARLEVDVTAAQAATRAGQQTGGDISARIAAARAVAPGVAVAFMASNGDIQSATGAEPELFRRSEASAAVASDGALLIRTPAAGGALLARVPVNDLKPARAGGTILIVQPDGAVLAQAGKSLTAATIRDLGMDPRAVRDAPADGRRLNGKSADDKPLLASAAGLPEGGLAVISLQPGGDRASAFADMAQEAWVLIGPLAVLIGLTAVLMFQGRRSVMASRAWADSERRFRMAVEAARCGVWEWDLARNEVLLSDFMAEMMGLPKGGLTTGDQVLERINPRHRERVVHALRQAAAYGAFTVSFRVELAGGGFRWLDARGQAQGERSSDGYDHILGVAIDITEARIAKVQAQAAQDRLRDGIESVTDAFVLFDRNGHLILWNKAFQDTFGFDAKALRPGAQKAELNRIAALAIKADQPSSTGRAGVREVELHDGRWLQLSERFTGDAGSVVTAADITAIKKQEEDRRQAAEALQAMVTRLQTSQDQLAQLARKYEVAKTRAEAANQAKSEFLANMSHELRTPLNAINGFSEIMAGEMFGPLGDAKYKGYANDILKSGQHLLSLINDILDMAKIEAGKMTLHYEKVDLAEVCQDAIRLMRGRAQESGLSISLDAPALPEIDADYRAVKQVLLNLISNAVKFTPEGGFITVAASQANGVARVAVTDTGIGIAADDLSRLAQPFEQVEGQHSKTTQGTGLGLALTKSLVEMHGGELKIESEPGRGTTVSFTVPVQKAQPAPEQTRQAA